MNVANIGRPTDRGFSYRQRDSKRVDLASSSGRVHAQARRRVGRPLQALVGRHAQPVKIELLLTKHRLFPNGSAT
jgi:hypothetical protein